MTDVILVDELDREVGTMEKLEAHQKGLLHRAFSIFVFNTKGELLLQQRNKNKYHSGGLWSNTCCSHPSPGEGVEGAAYRRLQEEMGFTTELKIIHSFVYKAPFDNGLTEHEFDYVLVGKSDNSPKPNPDEVQDYKWISISDLKEDITKNPDKYTYWFRVSLDDVLVLNK